MSSQVMVLLDSETPEPLDAYNFLIDKSDSQDEFVTRAE